MLEEIDDDDDDLDSLEMERVDETNSNMHDTTSTALIGKFGENENNNYKGDKEQQ